MELVANVLFLNRLRFKRGSSAFCSILIVATIEINDRINDTKK